MSITIKFPKNEDVVLEQGKPVVFLGANGSGKTRLSFKIEEINDRRVNNLGSPNESILIHRISAQKSLSISEKIQLTDYQSSLLDLYIGNIENGAVKYYNRYAHDPILHLLNDYKQVLAYFFAIEIMELQKAHELDKSNIAKGEERCQLITTIREKGTDIWNELLPQREIDLRGSGIHVNYKNERYHGKEMSDGERVILYMICQALVLPPDSILIIDEPELHIHKAIVKKLWDKLEQARPDCVFIYITHDLDFAASRNTDKILWVKNYDGTNWDYTFLNINDYVELPCELLYEIIGTRKKILFVEGERNSYDYNLYKEYFKNKDYHIIPCGGCSDVVNTYKAKKTYENLNIIEAYCLIDRDYRTDSEIAALKSKGVAFLEVAEVENLFIVPALIEIMGEQFGCTIDNIQKAKNFIIEMFNNVKAGQIGDAFIKEINHQLAIFDFSNKNATPEEIQNDIINTFSKDKIQRFFDEKKVIFDNSRTMEEILKVFNFKELSKKIGNILGIQNYPQRVITLLQTNANGIRKRILDALKPYIPDLP